MIKEDRIITRKNLKQLCVDFDLYTLGTSEEYEEMLKSAVFEGHLTTERIVEIAKNILEHSETDIELGSLCAGNHKITTRDKMITAFLIGTLLFLAAFMINIYIIRRF